MKFFRNFLSVCLLLLAVQTSAQKVSILGDSYSTFAGRVTPEWNFVWYTGDANDRNYQRNDVHEATQTWWSILLSDMGYTLERNNSFSGSTVCYTGYGKADYADRAFITRMCNLGEPDIILVLSGTNDSWAKAPVGNYQYKNWTRRQLYAFRPAFCYMMHYLTTQYPKARIINICNSELSPEVTETQATVCRHYKVTNVQLHDVEKQAGHPSQAGMRAIAEQVKAVLK